VRAAQSGHERGQCAEDTERQGHVGAAERRAASGWPGGSLRRSPPAHEMPATRPGFPRARPAENWTWAASGRSRPGPGGVPPDRQGVAARHHERRPGLRAQVQDDEGGVATPSTVGTSSASAGRRAPHQSDIHACASRASHRSAKARSPRRRMWTTMRSPERHDRQLAGGAAARVRRVRRTAGRSSPVQPIEEIHYPTGVATRLKPSGGHGQWRP
jgi:hypothetical protein